MTFHAGAAWPAPPPSRWIVVLDSPGASALARQCVTRVREELTAGGFDVSTLDPGPGRDPVSTATVMERQEGATAVVALVGDPGQPGAELWILDRVGTSPEVRRLTVPTDDAERTPEVLAIRTMEVLKASALKRLIESTQRPRPPGPATAAVASPIVRTRRFGVEAGISVLDNVGGPGPAAVPLVRGRAWLGDSLFARFTLAGLGSHPRVEAPTGSASVAQSFGLVELAVAVRPRRRFRPVLSVGAGAVYDQSDGEAVWPYQGLRQARWALALDAGIGLLVQVGDGLSFAFEVHALVSAPHSTVRFSDVEAARLGFPFLLASLTMVAWL